jgi:hypothetical protein
MYKNYKTLLALVMISLIGLFLFYLFFGDNFILGSYSGADGEPLLDPTLEREIYNPNGNLPDVPEPNFVTVTDLDALSYEDRKYVDFDYADFHEHPEVVRILFFYAPWSPSCRAADMAFVYRHNEIPAGIRLYKVDYAQDLWAKEVYEVPYDHVFVIVDSAGNKLRSWAGGELDKLLENMRPDSY